MKWNSGLYDNAQAFVSEYGKELVSFVPKKDNQKILDLGCGTGDLTSEIYNNFKCDIIGSDNSQQMIAKAKNKYPNINFSVFDACNIPYTNEFDVIFSNAVFHWIPNQEKLHQSIYNALKINGLLICEFGGYKNISSISNAFSNAVKIYGNNYSSPFYFPQITQHKKVLENNNYYIEKIYEFDRPTVLPNGHLGLRQWVCQFFSPDLANYDKSQQDKILNCIEEQLKPTMYDGTKWTADYKRLRVIAKK